jgi:CBS domain containing-hemolysin-like protein
MEELTPLSLLLRGTAVLFLVAANGFFVAAEFGLVAARRTRIEAMARRGDRKARTVQIAFKDLYRQLSAAQLGITLASILLGYVAEDTVAVVLHDLLASLPAALQFLSRAAFASVVAVAIITFLHVVIGEQAPKALAITHAETTSRWTAGPLIVFAWVTGPATNLLNASANLLVRLMGIRKSSHEHEAIRSPEEILMMLRSSQKSGQLAKEDVAMIQGVFEFTEMCANDVMTPRTAIIGLPSTLSIKEAADQIAGSGKSRYPVYRESLDDVVGIVHVKEMLAALSQDPSRPVTAIAQDPLFVPSTREVEDVLADMKRLKTHMAIVLDEHGGTDGLVTMEDLLEEIVGEIYDEYDAIEPDHLLDGDAIVVSGTTEVDDLKKQYGLAIAREEYLTIGGYLFGKLGRLPTRGDVVRIEGARLEIVEMDGRRVASVRIIKQHPDKTPTD